MARIALLLAALCISVQAQSKYGENYLSVSFDSQLVEQNAFPEPNVTLYSPAFLPNATFAPGWSEGKEGATSQKTLNSFLQQLSNKNPTWMTYHTASFLSEEGKSFPYVRLSTTSNATSPTPNKLRIWLQGSVHGNEPAGDEALLALLGQMSSNPTWTLTFLEAMDILVLLRYNPDGNAYFQRTLATNFDPNRDHVKLARQQTRDLKHFFSSFAPHIAVDMHEYGASTRYADDYSNAADGMYSAAKNLNIHPSIRSLSESVFAPAINASLSSRGLRGEPYMTASSTSDPVQLEEAGTDAKIGRNAMGLTQCITFLFETRGIRIADQSFRRRTLAGLQMVLGVLETARERADEVYQIIESAVQEFLHDAADVVVTDYTRYENRTFTMVDRRTGDVVQLPVEWASTTPATANLTRPRPEGYLIPRAWADLAERLVVSGLEVDTMDEPFEGTVQAYNITSSAIARSYYEGVIRNTVTTELLTRDIKLPAGSFFVSAAQKNAGLAFVALEPENIDSYVTFGIVPMEVGDEYPVFRKV
ncbi:Zn-dependent exopeptidase [Polyplosphaeria fusca]|uniref:Carboxypeptidase M14B n=1 Tax=Polyplosphaeria fusca TaxID=682080 RepID=A0A9P4UZF4_9PLEO|nr:Zn-dependent exopeptidase [Polyplosphaeria fusca]